MKKRLKQTIAILGAIALLSGLFLDIKNIEDLFKTQPDISGEWHFKFQVKKSTYNPYIDAVSEYRVHLLQEDNMIAGDGEKWKYQGKPLPPKDRDPLKIRGTVTKDTLYCKYNLQGTSRETIGSFKGYYKDRRLFGVFSGTAADTKGTFSAERIN